MRLGKNVFPLSIVLLIVFCGAADAAAQSQTLTVDQAIDRFIERERMLMGTLRSLTPLVETYIQEFRRDKELGIVPERDHYYLGKADLRDAPKLLPLTQKDGGSGGWNPFAWFKLTYNPNGFVYKLFVDYRGIDRRNYRFDYIRREFLGEIRCLVFDLLPLASAGDRRFKGRIWIEDREFNIVRFNGVHTPEKTGGRYKFHFDSWRVNTAPGLWVPAFIYTAESQGDIHFKAHTRVWGYNAGSRGLQQELGAIRIETEEPSVDRSQGAADRSPIESHRLWQRQAEQNVIERLEKAGLLATPGTVDKVLETVVNNLIVTNDMDIEEVRCRILLTSTLESFSFGRTIILSRGLLDVLPDEASLAAMLAHELAHILLGSPDEFSRWGFFDNLLFPTEETFKHFSFTYTPEEEALADRKATAMMGKSPYKDKLHSAGLFQRQLDAHAKTLRNLISPHLGNRVFIGPQVVSSAPPLAADRLDQIAALPLGARIKLNPWTSEVELLKPRPVVLLSPREKMPFQVTPFMPYLTRHTSPGRSQVTQSKPDGSDKKPR